MGVADSQQVNRGQRTGAVCMKDLLRVLSALAALIEEFVAAGGVEVLVGAWRARRESAEARARLDEERRLASALARGDMDTVESVAHKLLVAAQRSNSDRGASRSVNRSGFWNGDDHDEFVDGNDADVETMQREIDALIK